MSEKTGISWTDATFNPWWGCQKVSPACDHCYAERDAKRFAAGRVLWGVNSERRTFGDKHWQAPLDWAKTMPAKLSRRPRLFCASMGDWLDLDAPLDEFVRLLDTILKTAALDWLLLSKRIGNWRKRLTEAHERVTDTEGSDSPLGQWIKAWLDGRAPANVWLGATVVNQEEADRDIPKLLATPARIRFLSIEPMLGPIDLTTKRAFGLWGFGAFERGVDWVIAGGESGPRARPAHPDWFRSLRDQCAAAGVAFHFKQWGEWSPEPDDERGPMVCGVTRDGQMLVSNSQMDAHTDYELMFRVGKAAAGRRLDGVEHNAFPKQEDDDATR